MLRSIFRKSASDRGIQAEANALRDGGLAGPVLALLQGRK